MSISVLPVRRNLKFYLPAEKIDSWNPQGAHWTQFFNTLSIFFPVGENFFIKSVRNYRNDIIDKELQKTVSAFIGQEAFHSREHVEYNQAMMDAGIPVAEMEATVVKLLGWVQDSLPNSMQLAATVALEHLTAMLANLLLEDDRFIKDSDPHFLAIWKWHAMEETEHKGVVFDVYNEVVGTDSYAYSLRCFAFLVANLIFWSLFYRYYFKVMKSRGEHKNLRGWMTSLRNQFGKGGVFPSMFGEWLSFFRPDFHPWQHNNLYVLDEAESLMEQVDQFARKAQLSIAS